MAFPDIRMYGPTFKEMVGGKSKAIFTDDRLLNAVLERTVEDHGAAVYLSANYIFDGYILDRLNRDLISHGHMQITSPEDTEVVLRGAASKIHLSQEPASLVFTEYYAKRPSRDPNLRCLILQRIQFASHHRLHDLPLISINDKTIVMGVPTTSRATESVSYHPIKSILFPNIVETARSNPGVKFVLLVAFDENDRFLDDTEERMHVAFQQELPNLHVYFIRLIRTGSVAMIWNVMYDIAMRSGARYFYQLNDDIHFKTHDWPDAFMSAIDAQEGHGVVGPNDVHRKCNLLTQNFVGLGHWDIFGFLFPPDFRNWWSDNWIGALYELYGLRTCFSNIRIVNGKRKDGSRPRYQACRVVEYQALLALHADQAEPVLSALGTTDA